MHNLVDRKKIVFKQGDETSYGDTFTGCQLSMDEGYNAKFLNCVFLDCSFDPDINTPVGYAIWTRQMYGCHIDADSGAAREDQNDAPGASA